MWLCVKDAVILSSESETALISSKWNISMRHTLRKFRLLCLRYDQSIRITPTKYACITEQLCGKWLPGTWKTSPSVSKPQGPRQEQRERKEQDAKIRPLPLCFIAPGCGKLGVNNAKGQKTIMVHQSLRNFSLWAVLSGTFSTSLPGLNLSGLRDWMHYVNYILLIIFF